MTDPRDLIQRLVDELQGWIDAAPVADPGLEDEQQLLAEARAYLAQPEPAAGPTDEELLRCMIQAAESVPDGQCTGIIDWETEAIAAARAVLSRYAHQPPQPIPLSAREFLEPEWVKQEDQTRKTTDGAQLIDGEWWAPCSDLFSMQRILDNARAVLARDGHSPTQ